MNPRKLATFAVTVIAVFAAFASPATAARDGSFHADRRISVTGGVVVAEGEVVNGPVVSIDGPATIDGTVNDDVYVGNGRLVVRGHVTGDMLVVHGNVLITGRVGGDVVALDGRITVRDGAFVRGDVVSRPRPNVAPGTVQGKVKTLDVKNIFAAFLIAFLIYLWIAVTVSVGLFGLLFVLLFPRAADATVAAGRRFWPTVGWGALVGIMGPILGVVVLVTIVGIPFGLGILSALNVLAPLGYVASSLILGRLMVKGTSAGARIGAFFAGFGILRAAALIPGLGFIVWFLVCIYGLGAITQAAWRAGRRAPEASPSAQALEPHHPATPVGPPADEPRTLIEDTVPAATEAPIPAESPADQPPTTTASD